MILPSASPVSWLLALAAAAAYASSAAASSRLSTAAARNVLLLAWVLHAAVLAWLRSQGKGYQSRINAILRREMLASIK